LINLAKWLNNIPTYPLYLFSRIIGCAHKSLSVNRAKRGLIYY